MGFNKFHISLIIPLLLVIMASASFGKDYVIYSIAQDLPMGEIDEVVKKNYYINMGASQGLQEGTRLDVFRVISRLDPYNSKTRYNYKVKIGELKVLHVENEAAITNKSMIKEGQEAPVTELDDFMIGDKVDVSIND
ncbi:MAG: hypothetical protein ACOCUH_00230 [Bacteriovoracia bacterium]